VLRSTITRREERVIEFPQSPCGRRNNPAGPSVFDDAEEASRRPRDQSGSSAACAPLRLHFPKSPRLSRARDRRRKGIFIALSYRRVGKAASEGILHSAGRSSRLPSASLPPRILCSPPVFFIVFPATPAPLSSLEGIRATRVSVGTSGL